GIQLRLGRVEAFQGGQVQRRQVVLVLDQLVLHGFQRGERILLVQAELQIGRVPARRVGGRRRRRLDLEITEARLGVQLQIEVQRVETGQGLVEVRFLGRARRFAVEAQGVQVVGRSEEHTSELQSRENLVCRLLLEK